MARRLDRVRPGQDAVTHFLKEQGERLFTGVVRDGDSLGWIWEGRLGLQVRLEWAESCEAQGRE